jgi:hypothetical protein
MTPVWGDAEIARSRSTLWDAASRSGHLVIDLGRSATRACLFYSPVGRMRRAMPSPNFTDQRRTVSCVSSMPRAANSSCAGSAGKSSTATPRS